MNWRKPEMIRRKQNAKCEGTLTSIKAEKEEEEGKIVLRSQHKENVALQRHRAFFFWSRQNKDLNLFIFISLCLSFDVSRFILVGIKSFKELCNTTKRILFNKSDLTIAILSTFHCASYLNCFNGY